MYAKPLALVAVVLAAASAQAQARRLNEAVESSSPAAGSSAIAAPAPPSSLPKAVNPTAPVGTTASDDDGASLPNIVTVVIDDLGWSDVGWNDEAISSPTMKSWAERGVVLDRFYASPTCTPARAQFMTGRYNFKTGMQDSVIHSTEPRGVPLGERFVSEKLQDAGYQTVAIGKWHLGMHSSQYLPLHRGFDYHYGIYTGGGDHIEHISVSQDIYTRGEEGSTVLSGLNLWDGEEVSSDNLNKIHSTHLYSAKAIEYVEKFEETDDVPFFMYLAYQAVHDPIEVGNVKYITDTSCADISESTDPNFVDVGDDSTLSTDWSNRKVLCGMVAEIDDGLKSLELALRNYGEWDNTVIFLLSDNGGVLGHGSLNFPLRGAKGDYWEGGVRVPALLAGGALESALQAKGVAPYTSASYVHITDVHATILELASVSAEGKELDGHNQWAYLVSNGEASGADAVRKEVVININSGNFGSSAAIIVGEYKLMINPEPDEAQIYNKVRKHLAKKSGTVTRSEFKNIVHTVLADVLGDAEIFFFNIRKNPYELTQDASKCSVAEECMNLYSLKKYEHAYASLRKNLEKHVEEAVESTFGFADDGGLADPSYFGGVWSPWREYDGTPRMQYMSLYEEGIIGNDGTSAVVAPAAAEVLKATEPGQGRTEAVTEQQHSLSFMSIGLSAVGVAIGLVAYSAGRRQGASEYHTLG